MVRKPLSFPRVSFCLGQLVIGAFLVLAETDATSADTNAIPPAPKFLGADSCSSSGCHGGGGHAQNQFFVWSLRDVHHARPVATLTTARSRQIAAALGIKDPASANDCVSCHAPLREIPEDLRGPHLRINEGVSCESCHGPAENWLRSHTRRDYTHADRVASGMRDLKDLHVRANTCVACHQTVALPLLAAGHPELLFELDGQTVAQPRHWRETPGSDGAQAWLVGQAAALREICWQIETATGSKDTNTLAEKRDALVWLFKKISTNESLPVISTASPSLKLGADKFAREVSAADWSQEITSSLLQNLANAAPDFRSKNATVRQHARRAERLVLALDRLFKGQATSSAQSRLDTLFSLAQSIPDFDPSAFASALTEFAQALKNEPSLFD